MYYKHDIKKKGMCDNKLPNYHTSYRMNLLDQLVADSAISESRKILEDEVLPLFLYGNGKRASKVISKLEELGLSDIIQGIIVSDEFYNPYEKTFLSKYSVYSLSEVTERIKRLSIIIGYSWEKFSDLTKQLVENPSIEHLYLNEGEMYERRGYKIYEKLIELDWHADYVGARGITSAYVKENAEKFQQTLDWLEDEKSREVMISYLNGCIAKQNLPMKEVCTLEDQYFPKDCITVTDQECFIDCGAAIGDTILEFLNVCSGKYNRIYALEPSDEFYKTMLTYINENNLKNIITLRVGSHNSNTSLKFGYGGGSCGSFAQGEAADAVTVTARTLDSIIDKTDRVTFLKMDIEGGELDSLIGASDMIRRDRPKMAICVYHKKEDLILIPQYIKVLMPECKLYMRSHSPIVNEVVLYAVPDLSY